MRLTAHHSDRALPELSSDQGWLMQMKRTAKCPAPSGMIMYSDAVTQRGTPNAVRLQSK